MPTYAEYQKEIAKLQVLAEAARQEELAVAQKQVREIMRQYGLTAKDVVVPKLNGPAQSARYRDPVSGKTWSGRGRVPGWLKGRNQDEFRI